MFSIGKPITSMTMIPKTFWELKVDVNAYKDHKSDGLATQARSGRKFEIIDSSQIPIFKRIKVRLLEDGYICWLKVKDVDGLASYQKSWKPNFLSKSDIKARLPKVLSWIERTSKYKNEYLWGGTIGPNFDCSGLIQTAFASQGIWLPRDSYQQEQFCESIAFEKKNFEGIQAGDLVFFGSKLKCTHVGIYNGNGGYWHSSGTINGRNGIGLDELHPTNKNTVSSYYLSKLRSIGRVESCHDGRTLP